MNEKQALELAKEIIKVSNYGMWYHNDPASTNLVDYLITGDEEHIKNSTIRQLADEWDE